MENTIELKRELSILSETLVDFIENSRKNLSSKSVLIHDLKNIGFFKIGGNKWALDLKMHDISYVSFIVMFRGGAVDITEDHMVIHDGKEIPISSLEKPFTLTSVRYSRVIDELLKRVKELSEIFKNGEMHEV